MQNKHILINEADKGSTIVVKDHKDYLNNAVAHLSDQTIYKLLETDISPMLKQNIIAY